MKKRLPTNDIANELAGSSVFFPNGEATATVQPVVLPEEPRSRPVKEPTQASEPQTMAASNHATMPPRNHAGLTHDTATLDVEAIRQVVRKIGKEAATYRLTREEKQWLGEQVYRFGQKGYRTSENEITRIALNWLRRDHQARGSRSVLAQLLDALHR